MSVAIATTTRAVMNRKARRCFSMMRGVHKVAAASEPGFGLELIGALGQLQRVDDVLEVAVEHMRQVVDGTWT